MNCSILHRGPDEDGFYLKDNVGLAMRRLAIIDLASGQQPIHNSDKTKWIVYNGEVYDYQEIRRDLDSVWSRRSIQIPIPRRSYISTMKKGRTVFAISAACLHSRSGTSAYRSLFIARDRIGKKPLLYSHQPNGDLVFGSEFRALLEHPAISRDIDYDALDDYMSFLCVPAPRTAFAQIRKLEPGHWLRWRDGKIETHRYWQPDFSKKIRISETEAIEETTRSSESQPG